jgi:hypothetical protein
MVFVEMGRVGLNEYSMPNSMDHVSRRRCLHIQVVRTIHGMRKCYFGNIQFPCAVQQSERGKGGRITPWFPFKGKI